MFLKIEKDTKKVGLNGQNRIGQNITMDKYNFEWVKEFQYHHNTQKLYRQMEEFKNGKSATMHCKDY